MENTYATIKTELAKLEVTDLNIMRLELDLDHEISFKAGQIMLLGLPGEDEQEIYPRYAQGDKQKIYCYLPGYFPICSELKKLRTQSIVLLRGPFATEFPLDDLKDREIIFMSTVNGVAKLDLILEEIISARRDYPRIVVLLFTGGNNAGRFAYKHFDIELHEIRDVLSPAALSSVLEEISVHKKNQAAAFLAGMDDRDITAAAEMLVSVKDMKRENILVSVERAVSCGIGKCRKCYFAGIPVCRKGSVHIYEQIRDDLNA